jgi:hypothetical protein
LPNELIFLIQFDVWQRACQGGGDDFPQEDAL